LEGARELIDALLERGLSVVLASSAKEEEIEHYIELLGSPDVPFTTSADVEQTKPAPDLVHSALSKVGGDAALMVGDSTWDCIAAVTRRAGPASPVGPARRPSCARRPRSPLRRRARGACSAHAQRDDRDVVARIGGQFPECGIRDRRDQVRQRTTAGVRGRQG